MLSIDWSPGADAAARCEKAKEDDFGSDLYVLQGLKDFFLFSNGLCTKILVKL